MIIILIGSPFAGKTTILKKLQKDNIKIFHADSFIKKIYLKGGKGYKLIEKYFGKEFIKDQAVDRKKLGMLVIKDNDKLKRLNEIIHPIIKDYLEGKDNYVAELPIISSSPVKFNYDKLVLIRADKEEIIKRAKNNNSYYPFIEEMIDRWDKLEIKFDHIIDTSEGIKDQDIEYIKNLLKSK